MNVYQILIPQLLAAFAVLLVALRVIWVARRDRAVFYVESAKWHEEQDRYLAQYLAQMDLAIANPGVPASQFIPEWGEPTTLQLTLKLTDPHARQDIIQVTDLIKSVSEYERAHGGDGMLVTESKAERGRVVVTLTPLQAKGAAERVRKVADAVNAAFAAAGRPSPELGPLPAGFATAHAGVLLAA